MKLLLDTHVLLWTIAKDDLLPDNARVLIGNEENDIFFSLASVWEVAIKHASKPGKITFSEDDLLKYCIQSGFIMLPIEAKHIQAIKSLQRNADAPPHKDPFDRLLIAQAKTEGMTFITHDKLLPDYEEPCILAI